MYRKDIILSCLVALSSLFCTCKKITKPKLLIQARRADIMIPSIKPCYLNYKTMPFVGFIGWKEKKRRKLACVLKTRE